MKLGDAVSAAESEDTLSDSRRSIFSHLSWHASAETRPIRGRVTEVTNDEADEEGKHCYNDCQHQTDIGAPATPVVLVGHRVLG